MAFADNNKGELMILCAGTYRNFTVTSCPSGANKPKPENILKTKGQKRQFSSAKPENVLKTSQLQKHVGAQNLGDKLAENVDCDWHPKLEVK